MKVSSFLCGGTLGGLAGVTAISMGLHLVVHPYFSELKKEKEIIISSSPMSEYLELTKYVEERVHIDPRKLEPNKLRSLANMNETNYVIYEKLARVREIDKIEERTDYLLVATGGLAGFLLGGVGGRKIEEIVDSPKENLN